MTRLTLILWKFDLVDYLVLISIHDCFALRVLLLKKNPRKLHIPKHLGGRPVSKCSLKKQTWLLARIHNLLSTCNLSLNCGVNSLNHYHLHFCEKCGLFTELLAITLCILYVLISLGLVIAFAASFHINFNELSHLLIKIGWNIHRSDASFQPVFSKNIPECASTIMSIDKVLIGSLVFMRSYFTSPSLNDKLPSWELRGCLSYGSFNVAENSRRSFRFAVLRPIE